MEELAINGLDDCPAAKGLTDAGLTAEIAVERAGVNVFEINPKRFCIMAILSTDGGAYLT